MVDVLWEGINLGAQIALKTMAILIGLACNFSSGDLITNLPIMLKNYQIPDKLINPLVTAHESVYTRKIQIISSFMSSDQPDSVPEVLSTGRFPSDLQSQSIETFP